MNLNDILNNGDIEDGEQLFKPKWGFSFKYGRMYSAPELSFKTLKQLSDHFGTEEIDVDNYSQGGCDTCDYGSDYGHTIQIYNPTKNVEELQELVGEKR